MLAENTRVIQELAVVHTLFAVPVVALIAVQQPKQHLREQSKKATAGCLADAAKEPGVRKCELYSLAYAPAWITAAALVITTGVYEYWGRYSYLAFCTACAVPQVLLAVLFVDTKLPVHKRFVIKAHVWMAIFSFIGNYWYTHYFYTVLGAYYTFPSFTLNAVPLPLYFMTHPYFMLYHTLARLVLRHCRARFQPSVQRGLLQCFLVVLMAYMSAAAEAVTIAGFPYYGFNNRRNAVVIGSAFYGIYFLVSFPAYAALQCSTPMHAVCVQALAVSMGVLQLLDLVRLGLGAQLFVSGPSS